MHRPEAAVNQNSESSSIPSRSGHLAHGLMVLLTMAVGVAARLLFLAKKPFWFDECFSVEVSRLSWGNFFRVLWWREANMSMYYGLLRIWLHFGHSPFFIRSLSVLISAATVPAVYWLARLLYDRRVALIAAALISLNAYEVRYAQEARSYSLFVLLATLSSAFLVSLARDPARRNRVGYTLVSILAVYAHFYALLLLAAQWIVLRGLGHGGGETAAKISAHLRRCWIAIGVAVLPLLVFVAKTGAGPIRWIPQPGISDLLRLGIYFTDGMPALYSLLCLAPLIPAGKRLFARNQDWTVWRGQFLFVWLVFPVILTFVLSFARPVFLARYMIFCLPALVILVAAGLVNLRAPSEGLRALIICATLLLSAHAVPFVYAHDFDDERDATGAAAGFILDHTQPGDAIVFHIAATRVPYEFFRSLRAGENTASPGFTASLGPEIVFPNHGPGLDYRDFTGKPTPEMLRAAAASHARMWVVLMNNGPTNNRITSGASAKPDPTTAMLTKVLPEPFPKTRSWQFTKVEVRLYSKE